VNAKLAAQVLAYYIKQAFYDLRYKLGLSNTQVLLTDPRWVDPLGELTDEDYNQLF